MITLQVRIVRVTRPSSILPLIESASWSLAAARVFQCKCRSREQASSSSLTSARSGASAPSSSKRVPSATRRPATREMHDTPTSNVVPISESGGGERAWQERHTPTGAVAAQQTGNRAGSASTVSMNAPAPAASLVTGSQL